MRAFVYRIWPEEDEKQEVYRDILIQEDKSMEDFHHAVLDSFGLKEGEMASFFTCTDTWEEGLEIMLMDMGTMEFESVNILMQELTIGESVAKDIKYYKFMYDFLFPKRFKIERIGENTEIKEDVPVLLAEVGEYEVPEQSLSDLNMLDLEGDSDGKAKPKKSNDIFEGFDDFDQFGGGDDDEPTFENIDDLDI